MMTEDLNGEERAPDWPDNGVNRVPGGIDPRDFVGKKLEGVKDAGDRDDPRFPDDGERLIARRERDPMKVNGQSGGENGELKVNACEAGEAQRDTQEVQ